MTESPRFVFAGRVVDLGQFDPTVSVLRWLRAQGRRGAKEACCSGVCGACAVVVGERADGRIGYRAVNACALPLGSLDGKLLLTVEDLADGDGAPHPAQQALAVGAAAPCGYCAPGLVMTLFALLHDKPPPNGDGDGGDNIARAFTGAACGCAGLSGALAVARRLCAERPDDRFSRAESGIAALLESLERQSMAAVVRPGRSCWFPVRLEEAAELLARHPKTAIVAGGGALASGVSRTDAPPQTVMFLAGIEGLRQARTADGRLEIGAAMVCAAALPLLDRRLPALAAAVRRIEPPHLRNAATLVGGLVGGRFRNELAPILSALRASLSLNRQGRLREVAAAAFFADEAAASLAPGEFVQALLIPVPPQGEP